MGDLKFIPQSVLDSWADLGKIELSGSTLRITAEALTYVLTPSIRFLSILEGQDDNKLVGKVKSEAYVREIGGEVMTDSCLIGETAYQVAPGFLGEDEALLAKKKKTDAKSAARSPAEQSGVLQPFMMESID